MRHRVEEGVNADVCGLGLVLGHTILVRNIHREYASAFPHPKDYPSFVERLKHDWRGCHDDLGHSSSVGSGINTISDILKEDSKLIAYVVDFLTISPIVVTERDADHPSLIEG